MPQVHGHNYQHKLITCMQQMSDFLTKHNFHISDSQQCANNNTSEVYIFATCNHLQLWRAWLAPSKHAPHVLSYHQSLLYINHLT